MISTEVLTYHRHDEDDDEGPDRKRFKSDPGQTLKSPTIAQPEQNEAKSIEKIKNQLLQKEGLIYSVLLSTNIIITLLAYYLYQGRYTRVYRCFDEIAGTEIAIKEFDSVSKGLREAGILRRILPGMLSEQIIVFWLQFFVSEVAPKIDLTLDLILLLKRTASLRRYAMCTPN